MEIAMNKLAAVAVKLRYLFFLAFILAAIAGVWLAGYTNVNYDMTKYLPEDSPTNQALKVMEDEFGNIGYLQVMVSDTDAAAAESIADNLKEVDGVDSVLIDGENASYYRDNKALIKVYLNHNDFSEEATATIELIKKELKGYTAALSGYAVESGYNRDMIKHDLKKILLLCLAVVFAVLMTTSYSWADPLVFFCNLAVALLLNVGTNALLNSISFVSQAVCAVLQMALAMDYSIIILHRYHEEREKTEDKRASMRSALAGSMTAVAASSLTTVAGLCALMFMRFKIGLDIGGVLTKGIICSLLSSFFFMPAVILMTDRLLRKTRHRRLIPEMKALAGLAAKRKLWIPVLALILFVSCYFIQQRLGYIYEIEVARNSRVYLDRENIDKSFGFQNPFIVLVPKGDKEKEKRVIDYINSLEYKGEKLISNGQGLVTTGLYDELTLSEAAERFNTSEDNLRGVYASLGAEGRKALVYDMLKYLKESGYIIKLSEERQKEADSLCAQVKELYSSLTADEMADKYGFDTDIANKLWESMGKAPDTALVMDDVLTFAHKSQFFMQYAEEKQKELQAQYEAALTLTESYTASNASQRFGLSRAEVYGIMYAIGLEGFDESAVMTKAELIKYLYETTGNLLLADYYNSVIEAETILDAGQIKSDPLLGLLFNEKLIASLYDYYDADPVSDSLTKYQILEFVSKNQLIKTYAPAFADYQAVYDEKYEKAKELYIELTYKEAAEAFGITPQQAFAIYCINLPRAAAGLRISGRDLLTYLYETVGVTSLKESYDAMTEAFTKLDRDAVMKQSAIYNKKTTDAIFEYFKSDTICVYQLMGYTLDNSLVMNYGEAAQEDIERKYMAAGEASECMAGSEISEAYGIGGEWVDEIFSHLNRDKSGSIKKSDFAVYASESSLPLRVGVSMQEEIDKKYTDAAYAAEKFEGEKYARLIFNISAKVVSDEAMYAVKTVRDNLSAYYDEYYVLGSSVNICDIQNTFATDMLNINIISILAVFLIILILYRSVSIPILLVACIQGAIFINLSINTLTNSPVYFVCYLVAICIQMGATIDYGILLTDRYCGYRQTLNVAEAIREAMRTSSTAILTSGLVFVIAAAIVGFGATVPIISYIGKLISQGAVISVLTVILVLPQCLCIFDRLLEKGSIKRKFLR
jgi:predicted RND superfamily exporter protein